MRGRAFGIALDRTGVILGRGGAVLGSGLGLACIVLHGALRLARLWLERIRSAAVGGKVTVQIAARRAVDRTARNTTTKRPCGCAAQQACCVGPRRKRQQRCNGSAQYDVLGIHARTPLTGRGPSAAFQ